MAKLVISGAFVRIGKHFVSFIDLFESGFRLLIAGMQVWMVFFRKAAIGFFYIGLR